MVFHKTTDTFQQGTKTLPGHYYTSEAIFAEEVERIFYRRWVCVGRAEELPEPGDYITRQVGTESLILVRNRYGAIQAFYNLCRHRGVRLCSDATGHVAGTIRCPYHAWGYALTGELVAAPFMSEVEGFDAEDYALKAVAIATWEGFLFVNLSDYPEPFEQAFAPLLNRFSQWQIPTLRRGYRIDYPLHANWKILVQNYSECYHCPTVHPALVKMSPASSSANDLYKGAFLGGPMAIAPTYTSLSTSGRRTLPVVGEVAGDDLQRAYYYFIFPNLLLSLQPDFVMAHRLEPQSPDRTTIICEWLFTPDAIAQPDFDPSDIVHFWDTVNREDWQLCESMQLGVRSRAYVPGHYSPQESLLPEIDREVLKALGHLDDTDLPLIH
ncbi:aromatic ring-hydroxylating dioxygenase subunit alpha [Oscillatoria sp. FACHB-1407]|uniref:aromatic ring-hydroxylating oxygenase subunit alpha n=1 Tax=Oscillatoria sp. FACHB-1407 TaxID=2692847 RepID=UPI001689BC2A|nr:aromatic ring-hydroxylating dioxygenase subunit alpha [Oscillatoria sp. FACHB-1407]MBD2461800.1 aromatic ring-hydroxylating dioxygenase subunit alpha [Oscillatoria sp. FACHB-1407]